MNMEEETAAFARFCVENMIGTGNNRSAAWAAWQARALRSTEGFARGVEAAIRTAIACGNYGDMKREELTGDFGQPRFDMMNKIIKAIHALRPEPDAAVVEQTRDAAKYHDEAATFCDHESETAPTTQRREYWQDRAMQHRDDAKYFRGEL